MRQAVKLHRLGRPRLVVWTGLVIGQVVKHQKRRRLVALVRKLMRGTQEQLEPLIAASQRVGVLNTAFIERLNATFRSRLFSLVRKTRSLARGRASVHWGVYLVGTLYNFCTFHQSLTTEEGTQRTPAMAAGITEHCWSLLEMLCYRVPPPAWEPPKTRGRRSKQELALIQRWAT